MRSADVEVNAQDVIIERQVNAALGKDGQVRIYYPNLVGPYFRAAGSI